MKPAQRAERVTVCVRVCVCVFGLDVLQHLEGQQLHGACTTVCVCMQLCARAHVYASMLAHVRARVHARVYACTCVCVCAGATWCV